MYLDDSKDILPMQLGNHRYPRLENLADICAPDVPQNLYFPYMCTLRSPKNPHVPQKTTTFLKEPPRSSKNPYRLGSRYRAVPHVPQKSPYVPQNRINILLYTYVTYYVITG